MAPGALPALWKPQPRLPQARTIRWWSATGWSSPTRGGRDLPAETTDQTQQLIDRYVAQLAAADIRATGEVHEALDKGIGDALIDVAKSHQAGLIVLGTRGRSNVKSVLLGSVAHEVVGKSTVPVLVVPDKTS
jgi:nucleotide-binding universal stress UspA family protein